MAEVNDMVRDGKHWNGLNEERGKKVQGRAEESNSSRRSRKEREKVDIQRGSRSKEKVITRGASSKGNPKKDNLSHVLLNAQQKKLRWIA